MLIELLAISFLKRVLVNLVLVSFSRNIATVTAGAVKEKKGKKKKKGKGREEEGGGGKRKDGK